MLVDPTDRKKNLITSRSYLSNSKTFLLLLVLLLVLLLRLLLLQYI